MMFSGASSEKRTSLLSGGEKSRVLLGKIVATSCNLLLLDEPTHHLDMESVEALIDAMQAFPGTVVIVTHNEWILERIPFDKILLCGEKEQELFSGNYQDFLEKRGWDDERQEKQEKSLLTQTSPKQNVPSNQSREAEKQQRVLLLGERAKALKPLDQRVERGRERDCCS